MALVVAGCGLLHKRDVDALASGPGVETLAIKADYASAAIEVTGGLQCWAKTRKLDFDCVVTVYRPDDSFYLTEHHVNVYPWSNSIRISAQEPLSKFVWQLSNGRFSVSEGNERADVSPMRGLYRDYAEAILNVTTAPVRFLDDSAGFIKAPEPVKMEGLWYYPIEQTQHIAPAASAARGRKHIAPHWSKVIFYQNRDSLLVDMLWFADVGKERFLAVRGYNYKEVEKDGVSAPTQIEIFITDAHSVFKKRIAKIDVK